MRSRWIVAVVCIAAMCPAIAAEESKGGGQWSAEFSAANRYVWRGFVDGGRTGEVEVTYTRSGWEFCTSTQIELVPLEESRQIEVDFSLVRRFRVGRQWSFVTGYNYYGTPREEDEHGHEFLAGVEYSGPVDFSLKSYQFAVPHTGSYFSAELGRKLFARGRFLLRGDTSLGFNRHMGIDHSTFSDAVFTLTPAVRVRKGSFQPYVAFSKGLKKQYFDDHLIFGMKFVLGGEGE